MKTQLTANKPQDFPSLRLRIGLSLLSFMVCFCTLQWQMRRAQGMQLKKEEQVFVWTPIQNLSEGVELSRQQFKKKWQAAASVDPDAVQDELQKNIEGMRLRTELVSGSTLLHRDLISLKSQLHLADQVESGLRLYRLNEQANPFGWSLKNGDKVDLFLESHGQVQLLVESAKVLREQRLSAASQRNRCGVGVQLELSIASLATVLAAEGKGNLRLALRNPADTQKSAWEPKSKSSVKPRRRMNIAKRKIEHVR